MKPLFARFTLPCRDVTRLSSESMDRTLPLMMRFQVRIHLLICEGCRRYVTQLRAVRKRLHHLAGGEEGANALPAPRLSDEVRAKLKQALKSRRE